MKSATSTVFVCSADAGAGKTALILGMARRLARTGLGVGYWKPISPDDADSGLVCHVLDIAADRVPKAMAPDQASVGPKDLEMLLLETFRRAAQDRQVLFVEMAGPLVPDHLSNALRGIDVHPRALYLVRYRGNDVVQEIVGARAVLGSAFAGAIINAVPPEHEWFVSDRVLPALEEREVALLGVLPQARGLATPSIGELVAHLGAGILVPGANDSLETSFDNVMFGSMSAEDAHRYFSRRENKLVVTRGDRPDVHLAALGTSTRCLLLTGGYPSYPFVLDRAEELGIPVISVSTDMASTIERLDSLLSERRSLTASKLHRFEGLFESRIDWGRLSATAFPEATAK